MIRKLETMEKGRNCEILAETLSDNSVVYAVNIRNKVEIDCIDAESAAKLFRLLENKMDYSIEL